MNANEATYWRAEYSDAELDAQANIGDALLRREAGITLLLKVLSGSTSELRSNPYLWNYESDL